MTGCPHGFPKPANCVQCMEDGPLIPEVLPPGPFARVPDGLDPVIRHLGMRARFESDCPECSGVIAEGDLIARAASDGPFVHAECAS